MRHNDEQQPGVRLQQSGPVAILTVDRPAARNAIGQNTMRELKTAISTVAASTARVLVLTGAGDRVFVSGGDLKELSAIRSFDEAVAMATTMRAVLDDLASLPIPVVAALNGAAYGGGAEVAVACDIRVAADDVKCAFNQVSLGIMPAWGGVERLSAMVGVGRAQLLMTTGRVISAAEGFALGLFDVVVPRSEFADAWGNLATEIAQAPRDALVGIKAAQRAAYPTTHPDGAAEAIASFARTWIADTHWEMAEQAEQRRRRAR